MLQKPLEECYLTSVLNFDRDQVVGFDSLEE